MRIGLDIGSTTIKCAVLDDNNKIIFSEYQRHYSQITQKTAEILLKIKKEIKGAANASVAISGSAGMGIAEKCKIDFVQEVYATRIAAKAFLKDTDVIIELGGEDAKILYLTNGVEVRMNGTCAGGTGAFIDQMATLLDIELEKINELASTYEKTYHIASRCGVFAKSDIQPLLNQGARKSDIAESIFCAVVNQTIAGLAQGRPIEGNIVYLGGPLTFLEQLRKRFDKVLNTKGICPENSLYYVAMGAALCATKQINLDKTVQKVIVYKAQGGNFATNPPLFKTKKDYSDFTARHNKADVAHADFKKYNGKTYIGIDAGSTTVKAVVIGQDGHLLHEKYMQSHGKPVKFIREFLTEVYEIKPNIEIEASAVTGYGEEIIKNAFSIDFGVVETIAHFTAAKFFMPEVEFIIDIGGQDIKCFKIENGAISNIFLNEACSSGCGSFLQTFATALGRKIEEFAELGIFAKKPVDLGSRCTVFMNSSVKQAQKDGATIQDISAGLSYSVVKNALYKVIRAGSTEELGKKIVVQGGTFLNDAVLRAFEMEMGTEVIRPKIAGLMGAYGAALYAKEKSLVQSTIINSEMLKDFSHDISVANCGLCTNNCRLTINKFSDGKKFIGGNRCERPITKKSPDDSLNIYQYKLDILKELYGAGEPVAENTDSKRGVIGLPLGLNNYEMLPFWHSFFKELGFNVVTSPFSTKKIYSCGQQTIPSDTVCFPAKIMHGHVQYLIDNGIKNIFYPCLTYNIDESLGDNHYNCPVVAYYPEVIKNNMPDIEKVLFINDYLGIHRKKDFPKKMFSALKKYYSDIEQNEVKKAAKKAYAEYDLYLKKIRQKGREIIEKARKENKHIFVLSGRPYHIDPEINHGIDKLISSFGAAVISEDSISDNVKKFRTTVLNQWTYHSRLYAAAKYITEQKDMDLIQLVSFGCGVDAITTDEVREILDKGKKLYTQLKIDEITNLGAVKIRIRSLLAAIGLE